MHRRRDRVTSQGVVEVAACMREAQSLVSNIKPKVAIQTRKPPRMGETKEGSMDHAGSCKFGGIVAVASCAGLIGKLRKISRIGIKSGATFTKSIPV